MNVSVAITQPTTETFEMDGAYRAELISLKAIGELAPQWRELEEHADISFFVSWNWIGPWLAMALNNGIELYLYKCSNRGQTVALGIISRNRIRRRKIIRVTQLALNEVRTPGLDMVIEYNDLLIRRGHENQIRTRFIEDILKAPFKWDELTLAAVPEASWNTFATAQQSPAPFVDEKRTPWATDISSLNGNLDNLLAPLSRNRRWQIRRTFKAYEEEGELRAENARHIEEALQFFDNMGALHTSRWNSVGEAGSFANKNWLEFHQNVIREGFNRDTIQILKISCGDRPIGYIYSFIWRGIVFMLQSGFVQENDNIKRPGYVSHCLAMLYNARQGERIYDFMCGDAEYKGIFAKAQPPLVWGNNQKSRLALKIEHWCVGYIASKREKNREDTV